MRRIGDVLVRVKSRSSRKFDRGRSGARSVSPRAADLRFMIGQRIKADGVLRHLPSRGRCTFRLSFRGCAAA
jgi:hypothetical protein